MKNKSAAFYIGAVVGIIALASLAVAFQAWLLMMVLSWFAIKLTIWQCVAIVVLVSSLLSAAKSSNKS